MKRILIFITLLVIASYVSARAEEGHDDHAGHNHPPAVRDDDAESEGHDHPPSSKDYGVTGAAHAEPEADDAHEEVDAHDDHAGHDDEAGGLRLTPGIMKEFGIEVDRAAAGTLSFERALPGEVQVNRDRQAHIVPRYPGLVTDVRKDIGDKVKQGDVLAVLEGNESLTPYELKSLIDGTVIDKHMTVGESLGGDAVVFTIADLDTVWIVLTVFQKDLATIRTGQAAEISSGHSTQKGVISYISPTLDEKTRTASARIVLPNTGGEWKPGMFVTGRVPVFEITAPVVVPSTSVQRLEGEDVVFVREGDEFIPRPVIVGHRTPERVEIKEGLEPGAAYVRSGAFHLKAEIITSGIDPHAGHGH